jgi:hypothetical protein
LPTGNGVEMKRQADDESYDNGKNAPHKRSRRTKLKRFDDYEEVSEAREKRSGKRSHRRNTGKEDVWPDTDE